MERGGVEGQWMDTGEDPHSLTVLHAQLLSEKTCAYAELARGRYHGCRQAPMGRAMVVWPAGLGHLVGTGTAALGGTSSTHDDIAREEV